MIDFFIEWMTVLGRGLVFQPVLGEREREREQGREGADRRADRRTNRLTDR